MNRQKAIQWIQAAVALNVLFFLGAFFLVWVSDWMMINAEDEVTWLLKRTQRPSPTSGDEYKQNETGREGVVTEEGAVPEAIHRHFVACTRLLIALAMGIGMLVGVVNAMLIRAWVLLRREERRTPCEKKSEAGDSPRRE